MTDPAVLCRNLTKTYGRIEALRDLTLTVPRGSVFGLLGQNGAGKSTAIRILATLTSPTSGTVRVAGSSVTQEAERVRRQLGYLPQDVAFPRWMNGREYLLFAASLSGLPGAEGRARTEEILEQVGLTAASGRRIGGYSGGMRQRLGIAQALLHRPGVLILDEPVAALDPLGRRDVLQLIRRLRGAATVVLSSHILDDIDQVCDQVAILAAGSLLAQGSLAAVKERYAQPVFHIDVAGEAGPLVERARSQPWALKVLRDGGRVTVLVSDVSRAERELPLIAAGTEATLLRYQRVLPSLEEVFVRLVDAEKTA
ncbi:MAG: ABC transporter ATP-binding protein [Candidatus Dormibacteria bacterium]